MDIRVKKKKIIADLKAIKEIEEIKCNSKAIEFLIEFYKRTISKKGYP
mgnify:CR=1 FL=1